MAMKVETLTHPNGEQIPMVVDSNCMPIVAPSEFLLSRRSLSTNTLTRNGRELAIMYRWLHKLGHSLQSRILCMPPFTEADIVGGLVEVLRRDYNTRSKVRKIAVAPFTLNQRITTAWQFLKWNINIVLQRVQSSGPVFDAVTEQKGRLSVWLGTALVASPPTNKTQSKSLTDKQIQFLVDALDPGRSDGLGRAPAVRHRNFCVILLLLATGIRPGELLLMKVEDVQFGAIASVNIIRRPPDKNDRRRPRPRIKRNGRTITIEDAQLVSYLNEYILTYRDELQRSAKQDSDYLILSDEGDPLSQSALTQLFQHLRDRFRDDLPPNFSPKMFRHTFSRRIERALRMAGMEEENRKQALALLRGDSSLSSQQLYIAQEIGEQARKALATYQESLTCGGDVPC